jgi:hypothetical protein
MALDFARALIGRGVPAEVKYVAGAAHRGFARYLHKEDGDVAKAVLDFMGRATR